MVRQIGSHRVRCGDIFDNLDELYGDKKIDIFYSDPPWGNLEFWQTLNNKMTGAEKKKTDLLKFLQRFFDVAVKYTKDNAPIFVEYGIKWNQQLVEIAMCHGLKHEAEIEMLYGSPARPMVLNIFSKTGDLNITSDYKQAVYHTKGYKSLLAALVPFTSNGATEKKLTITDPCCGLGYTARYAIEHGLSFYGNELNQARLDKTIAKLS